LALRKGEYPRETPLGHFDEEDSQSPDIARWVVVEGVRRAIGREPQSNDLRSKVVGCPGFRVSTHSRVLGETRETRETRESRESTL